MKSAFSPATTQPAIRIEGCRLFPAHLSATFRRGRLLPIAIALCGSAAFAQGVALNPGPEPVNPKADASRLAADYGKLPLSFAANHGQANNQVWFTSRGDGYSLFLTDEEAVLSLSKDVANRPVARKPGGVGVPNSPNQGGKRSSTSLIETDNVRMRIVGARPGLKINGEDKLPGVANYFIGSDPSKWHSNVPTYAKVRYSGVYPGVDLVYYGNQGRLEYDFVIAPEANPKQIKLHFTGANKLKLDRDGNLTVIATNGEIAFHKPVVYQLSDGQQKNQSASQRQPVDGKFTLQAGNTVGFKLGNYDRNRALVIDPTLVYSTYLGGIYGEVGYGIAVDAYGCAYVTGQTFDTDFPVTAGALQTASNAPIFSSNAFITKFNPAGSALMYSTYLGGNDKLDTFPLLGDYGVAIAVDAAGDAFVTGFTGSTNFPVTKGAFQTTNEGAKYSGTAFVTELNPGGSGLVYSTLLGGSGGDYGLSIALNGSGNAYVAGTTGSTNFPITKAAFQKINKGAANQASTAFVTELSSDGTGLVYSTYLGGSGGDHGYGIAVDADGNAYVTGGTSSKDFPVTQGAFQATNKSRNYSNAFITKLDPAGTGLVYSTYLGGAGVGYPGDQSIGIAVDAAGYAYVTGEASSRDFPVTLGAFQTSPGDIFVTKIDLDGTALVYSSYLGDIYGDSSTGIAVDAQGRAQVTGTTYSTNFPVTKGAFQTVNNTGQSYSSNAFMTEFSPSGSSLNYSTYLGGSSSWNGDGFTGDAGGGIALDRAGSPYLTGTAGSADFPITSYAFQHNNNGEALGNVFVTRFVRDAARTSMRLTADNNPAKAGETVTFTAEVYPVVGHGIPTGAITFTISGKQVAVVPLDNTGHAEYPTSTIEPPNIVGTFKHWIEAYYSGDTHYSASYNGLDQLIVPAASLPQIAH
jgi:hypothetical protein